MAEYTISPKTSLRFASLGRLLLALCLLSLSGLVQAQTEFPALTGRVVDQASLLDTAQESALIAQLDAHEQETGNQLVVATINSLDGRDIADYANRLGRFWQIGTSENDNGVLLVVAPNERKVRIEVGYGLEGALTDSLSSIIIQREILPAFRKGGFAQGIQQGVNAILLAIQGEYTPADSSERDSDPLTRQIGNFIPLIFIAMVGIPHLLRKTGYRKAANGAFPAGFAGLAASLGTGNLLIGLAAAVVAFLVVYFMGSGKGGGGGSGGARRNTHIGSGGFRSGGSLGGGGFSGGGGSFGGGGASGGW